MLIESGTTRSSDNRSQNNLGAVFGVYPNSISEGKMNIIDYADLYAERAHKGQVRKYTGEPYIEHPRRVAWMIQDSGPGLFHPSEVAAALLHDVVEDCGVSPVQLERDFGAGVCGVVMALTNPPKDACPSLTRRLTRRQRKELERERLGAANWIVQSIKCADRIDNLTDSICFAAPGFLRRYLEESRLLHQALTKAIDPLRDKLITVIQELEQGGVLCNGNR